MMLLCVTETCRESRCDFEDTRANIRYMSMGTVIRSASCISRSSSECDLDAPTSSDTL